MNHVHITPENAPASQSQIDRYYEETEAIRTTALRVARESLYGLDLDRVEQFVTDQGLPLQPYAVVDSRDVPRLVGTILENHTMWGQYYLDGIDQVFGRTFLDCQFALIVRDEQHEYFNKPEFTESVIVHELFHLATDNQTVEHRTGYGILRQSGFTMLERSGHFFEEGAADYLRGKYIEDVTGRRHGNSLPFDETTHDGPVTVTVNGHAIDIPGKYVRNKSWQSIAEPAQASMAATGLEMLIQRQPSLWQTIIEARYDDAGVSHIAPVVDAMQPGLFRELNNVPWQNYALGAFIVKEHLA